MTSQTELTKCKLPPYAAEWKPSPWKFSAYATAATGKRQALSWRFCYPIALCESYIK